MSSEKTTIVELNSEKDLWSNIKNENNTDDLKKYRSTACPIMGDDDADVDDETDTD